MIERLLELIAPDECWECQKEGLCLCWDCQKSSLIIKKPACAICNKANPDGKTCKSCVRKSSLSGAVVAYRYEGVVRELVKVMKYSNKRSHARFFAGLMPRVDADVVCFVPSDGKTRRIRGYDQAEIIAKTYASLNRLAYKKLLIRQKHRKQVGLNRTQRIENIRDNFIVSRSIAGKRVLIVDDVITTGATVSECARMLKISGAKSVWAVAIAKG